MYRHPEVATRDCRDCMIYVYDDETGERKLWRGKPQRRPKNTRPPCGYPGKKPGTTRCPKGTPGSGSDFYLATAKAFDHFLRCAAVNRFPDDPIVAEHAKICRAIQQSG